VVGYSVIASGAEPYTHLYNTTAGVNQKWLRIGATNAGKYSFEGINDAYSVPVVFATLDVSGLVLVGGLTTAGGAFLHTTSSALTAGATGNVPTLTAGPVTGNPTKWFAISDNGTTRYVPSW
jgi:hypothetical protein